MQVFMQGSCAQGCAHELTSQTMPWIWSRRPGGSVNRGSGEAGCGLPDAGALWFVSVTSTQMAGGSPSVLALVRSSVVGVCSCSSLPSCRGRFTPQPPGGTAAMVQMQLPRRR